MNNEFQNKLRNYEATPPEKIWPLILTELDEPADRNLERLYNFEAQPDGKVWDKITEQLNADTNEESKVIPFYKKYYKAFRYGFAAAILITFAIGISLLFTKNSSDIAINPAKVDTGQTPVSSTSSVSGGEGKANSAVNNLTGNHSKKAGDRTTDKNDMVVRENKDPLNRYTTMSNEKGKVVRLSKKVVPVFNCADNTQASNNQNCKENIQTLQRKMATSLVSPTTDFAGLIDMLKDLKENYN
jgi:hypothetical protein